MFFYVSEQCQILRFGTQKIEYVIFCEAVYSSVFSRTLEPRAHVHVCECVCVFVCVCLCSVWGESEMNIKREGEKDRKTEKGRR